MRRRCAGVQEIAEWLDKLGMSEYAQRFAENGIGVAALRHLTDQDLKDVGVLLGHRRVMLALPCPLELPRQEGQGMCTKPRRSTCTGTKRR